LLLSNYSFSQERFGISNSIYAGITNNWLNPAFMVNSPYKWDINVAMVHSYADNNYLYLYQTNIPDLAKDKGKTEIIIDNLWNSKKGNYSKYMLVNKERNSWRKNVYAGVIVQGPSLMFNIKKWTFSFQEALRASASVTRLHKTCADFVFEGQTYNPYQNIDITIPKVRANAMVWDEIGVSAAREVYVRKDYHVKGGITLKHLDGLAAAFILNDNIQIYVPNDSDMYFNNVTATYGYAFNEDDYNNSDNGIYHRKGNGFSTDIGITLEKKTLSNKYQCPNFCNKKLELQYAWKLGFSLIDIGYVRFKKDAKTFFIDNKSDKWYDIDDIKTDDMDGIDSLLSDHFNKNPFPVATKTRFSMFLPWAASLQFDYNLGYNFYVNGTWVQRIPHFGLPGIDRANSIAITPRFDQRRIGIALPIVFHQYLWPRIGLALRLNNFLVVGTDKLGAFAGNRLSGADIYVILKINVFTRS
jgi:hypothetical protein